MKAMTKVLLCLSLGASIVMAAPKPLLNPFADTMNTSATQTTTAALPTQDMNAQTSAGDSQGNTQDNMQLTALPTMSAMSNANNAPSEKVMTRTSKTRLVVKGQGVAPSFTQSPAQAFALAKRAAMVDAYRLLGEKIQGVKVEGQDLIKNMMVKRSQVRTEVNAMIREATVIETVFKDGLCEIEVELVVTGARWHGTLSHAFAE